MALEDLLAPVKWVDKQVLREYTKLTKKWEAKGRSRYALSNWINISSSIFILTNGVNDIPISLFMSLFIARNFAQDNVTKPYGSELNVSDSAIAERSNLPVQIDRVIRLPFLLTGLGLTGFGLYKAMSGFYNKDNQTISEGITNIKHGVPFLSVASCYYIKDADPKLLDKAPFWETAYSWAKDRLSSVAPQPTPQPVPVKSYATLEHCI